MLFTTTNAARILNALKVSEVRVLANVVLVRFKNQDGVKCATYVSKNAFRDEFVRFRADRGAELVAQGDVVESEAGFYVSGSNDVYEVVLTADGVECPCHDLKFQKEAFGGNGVCYHGYAALKMVGFSRLSDYVQAQKSFAAEYKVA